MKTKNRLRDFLSLFLVLISGLIIFISPMVRSIYDGNNHAGFKCNIDFKVNIFGNWVESQIFYNFSEGTETGSAAMIGSYFPVIIPLISIALVLSLFGMMFIWSRIEWSSKVRENKTSKNTEKIIRIIGSILSITSGLLGIISLILYGIFKSTIIQPYDGFPSNNTPVVYLTFWFYISVLCFSIYLTSGIFTIIRIYKSKTNHQNGAMETLTIEEDG